jgi:hypothetical protein
MVTDCGQGIRLSAGAIFSAAQPWQPSNSHAANKENRKDPCLKAFFVFIALTPFAIVKDLAAVVKKA